jgi:hypothetical protein
MIQLPHNNPEIVNAALFRGYAAGLVFINKIANVSRNLTFLAPLTGFKFVNNLTKK